MELDNYDIVVFQRTSYDLPSEQFDFCFKSDGIAFLAIEKIKELINFETCIYKGRGKIELNHVIHNETLYNVVDYLVSLGFTCKYPCEEELK